MKMLTRQLRGSTSTCSLTMNSKFSIPHKAFIENSYSFLVTSCRYIRIIHSLSACVFNLNDENVNSSIIDYSIEIPVNKHIHVKKFIEKLCSTSNARACSNIT